MDDRRTSQDAKGASGIYEQQPDGSWQPATPIGWQEEHGRFARLVLWLLRRPHCCDAEMERYRR